MRRGSSLLLSAAIAAAAMAPSCSDPVHDDEVNALGPEYPGIPPGEYHRAGQPCTVCHGPEGPAKTVFSVAGTIFWQPYVTANGKNESSIGANNVTVSLIDDNGVPVQVVTNCVGNFWISPGDYNPAFPMLAAVFGDDSTQESMGEAQIGRTGSCATCHADPPNYNALGHVYVTPGAIPAGETNVTCPADPNLADEGSAGLP